MLVENRDFLIPHLHSMPPFWRCNFWRQRRMPTLQCSAEILQKSSTRWLECTNVTDDRQTDGFAMT